ncbi:hypothetical protein GCM10009077_11490 [Roseibium denhamense]|uniref:Uncharacterized protein n=2 Tax=Roseibium denhamense TaxID=76305 RepID=A0ABY1NE19_9HYPH|nr:hypothetical protein SAMN06265374_0870 [Roseibium denhamense]
MRVQSVRSVTEAIRPASFPPALLFLVAAALMVPMWAAAEPAMVLPLAAFLVMAGLTRTLAGRVYRDLAHVPARR